MCLITELTQFQTHHANNSIILVSLISKVFWSFALVFMLCEMGFFHGKSSVIDKLNFYLFPRLTQRKLPIVRICVQQPVFIRGNGNILCVREVFKNVSPIEILQFLFVIHVFRLIYLN